jgi:hypothetical protein
MRFVVRYAWLGVLVVLGSLAFAASASATATKTVNASGFTTNVTCEGSPASFASIAFEAQKSKGVRGGDLSIEGPNFERGGSIESGTINKDRYSLTGTLFFARCGASVEPTPATFRVSGRCGTNVAIHYSDSIDGVNDFTGNVSCA